MSHSLESLMPRTGARSGGGSIGLQLTLFLMIGVTGVAGFLFLSSKLIALKTGWPDWTVSALCYGFWLAPSYIALRRLVFRSDAPHGYAVPRYLMVESSGIALATLFSFVAYGVFRAPPLFAGILVLGLTSGVNFAILRLWAFGARK